MRSVKGVASSRSTEPRLIEMLSGRSERLVSFASEARATFSSEANELPQWIAARYRPATVRERCHAAVANARPRPLQRIEQRRPHRAPPTLVQHAHELPLVQR